MARAGDPAPTRIGRERLPLPDIVFFPADRTDLITDRGVEGAPLAAPEVRSPDDETSEKLDFWAALGVPEVIVIEAVRRATEIVRLVGSS